MQKDGLPIELELQAERANALALSAEQLLLALADLTRAEAALADAVSAQDRQRCQAEQILARVRASERLWFLVVQREAMGLTDHEAVMRTYQVPAEVRRHAGPRPARYRTGVAPGETAGPGADPPR